VHCETTKEQAWLKKVLGDWSFMSECDMGPDQPRGKFKGSERVRALGDVWVIGEGEGEMPGGGTGRMLLTIGFDGTKKRFVGSWVGSMMTNLWTYDGELDAAGHMLTLNAEGPAMDPSAAPGTIAKYQDVHEFKSDSHRVLTSRTLTGEGKWVEFMKAEYRKKA